jgi:hypothetical protein
MEQIELVSTASAEELKKEQLSAEEMNKAAKRDFNAVEKEKNEGGEPSKKK